MVWAKVPRETMELERGKALALRALANALASEMHVALRSIAEKDFLGQG
jgi:hypothetical protein